MDWNIAIFKRSVPRECVCVCRIAYACVISHHYTDAKCIHLSAKHTRTMYFHTRTVYFFFLTHPHTIAVSLYFSQTLSVLLSFGAGNNEGNRGNTLTHCNPLQPTATHCNTLQHAATRCSALQRMATHCNTPTTTLCSNTRQQYNQLQHTAAHYNTLQHAAAHCNIWPRIATLQLQQHSNFNTLQQYDTTIQPIATHGGPLHHTATHCSPRHPKHTQCNTPSLTHPVQHTHCNTPTATLPPQHTADIDAGVQSNNISHCNTVQPTHCNPLQKFLQDSEATM